MHPRYAYKNTVSIIKEPLLLNIIVLDEITPNQSYYHIKIRMLTQNSIL